MGCCVPIPQCRAIRSHGSVGCGVAASLGQNRPLQGPVITTADHDTNSLQPGRCGRRSPRVKAAHALAPRSPRGAAVHGTCAGQCVAGPVESPDPRGPTEMAEHVGLGSPQPAAAPQSMESPRPMGRGRGGPFSRCSLRRSRRSIWRCRKLRAGLPTKFGHVRANTLGVVGSGPEVAWFRRSWREVPRALRGSRLCKPCSRPLPLAIDDACLLCPSTRPCGRARRARTP